jgi:glucosyl-dolichyl phosphate glucuronosyltransferase
MTPLSAIVCTHNRLTDLRDCLSALAMEPTPKEVIVVDSASNQRCDGLVESFRDQIPDLRYVRVEKPGLSLARNAGIDASTGEIVAFLDDDTAPLSEWGENLLAAFARSESVGCVGGACIAGFDGPRPAWLSPRLLRMASITMWDDTPRQPRSAIEWPYGANVAFRRQALEQVGMFSTALGRNGEGSLLSGEEMDMVARVIDAGWEVWLEPKAPVRHKVHAERLTSRYYWRRFWWEGVSRAQHPTPRTSARLLVSGPVWLLQWTVTRDRYFMYLMTEPVAYFTTLARRVLGIAQA